MVQTDPAPGRTVMKSAGPEATWRSGLPTGETVCVTPSEESRMVHCVDQDHPEREFQRKTMDEPVDRE